MDCSTFDWTAFDAMINLFDTFIIVIPAIITFIHYKVNKLEINVISKTNSGIKLCLHNVSRSTIFVLKASLDSKELHNKIDIIEYFTSESNEKLLSIKPDCVISLTLDYTIMNISPIKKGNITIYNGNHKIKKKLK